MPAIDGQTEMHIAILRTPPVDEEAIVLLSQALWSGTLSQWLCTICQSDFCNRLKTELFGRTYGELSLAPSIMIGLYYFFYLARSANVLTGLYILPSVISSFLTWAKLSQDLLDRLSRSFHQTKGICVNFLNPNLFLLFRDVAMATDFGKNLRNDFYSTLIHLLTLLCYIVVDCEQLWQQAFSFRYCWHE